MVLCGQKYCLLLASDTPASVWRREEGWKCSVLWTQGERGRATHRSTLLLAFSLINACEANFSYFLLHTLPQDNAKEEEISNPQS